MTRGISTSTPFATWIHGYGVRKLASDMRVSRYAVYGWLSGASIPRTDRLYLLPKISSGAISVTDVLEHAVACRYAR